MSPDRVRRTRMREDVARVRYGTHTGRAPRARRMPFALLVVAMIVGGLVVLLALNTATAANELRANALSTRDDAVANDVQQLRIDVADDAAPDHLAAAAEDLGMVPADAPAFIVLGANGSAVLEGHPQAARGGALPVPLAPSYAKKVASDAAAKASSSAKPTTSTKPTSAAGTSTSTKPSSSTKSSSSRKANPPTKSSKPTKSRTSSTTSATHHHKRTHRSPSDAATTGGHR